MPSALILKLALTPKLASENDTQTLIPIQVWGKTGGKLYGQRSGADYSDNQKRFVLFNKAAIEALTALPFSPGEESVVVANDWHTAMFPVLLKVTHLLSSGSCTLYTHCPFNRSILAVCLS